MSVTVIRAGLDTVEVSLSGEFCEAAIERLDRAREVASASGKPQSFSIGAIELAMQPKAFGFWRWRLVEPRFHIVGRRKAAGGSVVAQVRFSAFGLANEDPALLWTVIQVLLGELGTFKELAVSRADVCVDFQGWTPTRCDMKSIVCPASHRRVEGTESQDQTFTFGKRTLLRVYDKTAEILVSKKTWVPELWGFKDVYSKGDPVWRAEFQAAGEVVKELGITNVEQLFANPGALLDYGLRWAQLRMPTADATKTRWPEDPRWTALRQAVFDGVPLQRRVKPCELMTLDAAESRLIGLAALAGAYFGEDNFIYALKRLSMAAEMYMIREKVDFAALVEEKRLRIISGDA